MLLCADSGGYLFKRLDKKRINIRLCGGYDSFHKRVGLCAGVVNNRTEELTRLRIGEGLRVLGTDNVRGGTELHIRRVRCPRIPAGRESSNFKRPVLDEVPRLYRIACAATIAFWNMGWEIEGYEASASWSFGRLGMDT